MTLEIPQTGRPYRVDQSCLKIVYISLIGCPFMPWGVPEAQSLLRPVGPEAQGPRGPGYLICYTLSGPERASYKRYIDDIKTGLIYTIMSTILRYFQGPPGYPGYFYNQITI